MTADAPTVRRHREPEPVVIKALIAIEFAGVALAAAFDATAQTLVYYGAAVTAVWIIWRQLLVPLGSLLKHGVAIVKKTATALDALEHLPQRWAQQELRDRERDERLATVEAEVGIVHSDIAQVANELGAVRRELGIGDELVRRPPPL